MADFWSQYQNDFPSTGGGFQPAPTISNPPQYQGPPTQGGSLEQMPQIGGDPRLLPQQPGSDFGMGGFPQSPYENDWSPRNPDGSLVTGPLVGPDPRLTMQPQPQVPNMKPQSPGAPSSGMGYSNQTGMLSSQPMRDIMGGVGNWMQGGSAFGGSQNPVAVQAVAHQMNPTMQGAVGQSQPMNPSQQNQTLMQSPDGQHFQYVNQEHVPHYQGLGATLVNGSSYGGM